MKLLKQASFTLMATRTASAFVIHQAPRAAFVERSSSFTTTSSVHFRSASPLMLNPLQAIGAIFNTDLKTIDYDGMKSMVSKSESGKSNVVILDVRGADEIQATGPLSKKAKNLPLGSITELDALLMEATDFKTAYGFAKPGPNDAIVFSCKKGGRAKIAADVAVKAGYTNVSVYAGSADEWFSN